MSSDLSLLIACKALFPFITPDLLVDADTPTEGARRVRISDVLRNLADQDRLFGLHIVDDIVAEILILSQEHGWDTWLVYSDFTHGRFARVGQLATTIRRNSGELPEPGPEPEGPEDGEDGEDDA
jgi:hypothetical protein